MAFGKKKGFSASQTRRTARRMNDDSMIGSHVERTGAPRGRHAASGGAAGTDRVDFSNARRSQRATRGYVEQVDPQAASAESDADYARRTGRRGYVEQIQATQRKRKVAVLAVLAVVVVAIAAVAGISAFFAFSDSRLSLAESNAADALVAAEPGQPYYVLCTAELGTAVQKGGSNTDAYLVVRIDEGARQLTFVSVPQSIRVEMSDGQSHPLYESRAVGGDAELIANIGSLLGVDIAHFARTDAEGLSKLVDIVGGVPVTLTEEVDDPRAGIVVLGPGEQVLDANQALTLLRASNFTDALAVQADNRALFTVNLAARASSGEGLSFASVVGDAAAWVETDWTSAQIIALGDAMRPLTEATVYACVVPGHRDETDDADTYTVSNEELARMMEAVREGAAPGAVVGEAAEVDRARVTVEVRNGAQVTGAAARMGELLESSGYQVTSVGNVDDGTLYPETLVIYKGAENEAAAKAVEADIAGGRVVNGGDFYTFNSDVLVIIGTDWVPAA